MVFRIGLLERHSHIIQDTERTYPLYQRRLPLQYNGCVTLKLNEATFFTENTDYKNT